MIRVDCDRQHGERVGQLQGTTAECGGAVNALAVLERKAPRSLDGVGIGRLLERRADQVIDDVERQLSSDRDRCLDCVPAASCPLTTIADRSVNAVVATAVRCD